MKIYQYMLNRLTLLYLSFPLLIFLLFWLKPIFSLITILSLILILISFFKSDDNKEQYIQIDKIIFVKTIVIGVVWCILAGIGGLFYQNQPDWHYHNAIMHDLIDFSWPVIYDNGSALVSYFGYTLPSALFGKFIYLLGCSKSIIFRYSNYFELLWSSLGVILLFLNLFSLIKVKDSNKLFICLLFIIFSGIDILIPYSGIVPIQNEYHINDIIYPSNTTQLFFAHEQVICLWIIISLFLKNTKNISNFGLYIMFTLLYSPLVFQGVILYFVICLLFELIKSIIKKSNEILKQIFSINNICSVLVIIIILLFLYTNNIFRPIVQLNQIPYNPEYIADIFWEAGIFLLLLLPGNYKNLIYWIMFVYLILFPLFYNMSISDSLIRNTVPSLTVMCIFSIKLILNNEINKKEKIYKVILTGCVILGAFTPACEIVRGFLFNVYKENYKVPLIKDDIQTFNKDFNNYQNCLYYISKNPYDFTFWKYISKNKKSNVEEK